MKVIFKENRKTAAYGDVEKNQEVTVSKADGEAFIKSGMAKKAKAESGGVKNGR